MIDPSKLTPAQRKAVVEIGHSRVLDTGWNMGDRFEWALMNGKPSAHWRTIRNLIIKRVLIPCSARLADESAYRLTPEWAEWAKEQGDALTELEDKS